ncbi:MAG: hypothetical protein ACRD3W_25750, partial [Terriglobales bacterium]
IKDGVRPRIQGNAARALTLDSGRTAIIMHIPRSWSAPHMAMNTSDWGRFYSRNSAGKYLLDIGEIRSSFLRSATVGERTRAFRAERLAKIVAGETPRLLPEGAKIVLHLIPFGAFDPGANYPVTAPEQRNNFFASLHPIGTSAASVRLNFDGVIRYSDLGYVQFFRNGCVEAVDTQLLKPYGGRKVIPSAIFEQYLIVVLRAYLPFLNQLGVQPPIAIGLTLLGVRGYEMAVNANHLQFDVYPVDRDDLLVPEEVIDSYDQEADRILKPSFDVIWNATGWGHSHNYDENGHWKSP